MQLSIVVPSNRDSWAAYATIMRACSWSSETTEVVVRDNSGNDEKREILSRVDRPNCCIAFAPPCDALTNFDESLRMATGDFVLFMGDDDCGFDRGIAAMAAASGRYAGDPSVAGLTGAYVLEESQRSQLVSYAGIDSNAVVERLDGFLGYQGPNLIFYSAIRRQLALETFEFINSHPFRFSFHDNLYSLIYLLAGKFVNVGRLTFLYDNANWETMDVGAAADLKLYLSAGLDPGIRQFHWILCGFEGARIILHTRFGLRHSPAERQALAVKWFELMFKRFAIDPPDSHGSVFARQAAALREKLLRTYPNFLLDDILAEFCGFIRLASPERARLYGEFWMSTFSAQ